METGNVFMEVPSGSGMRAYLDLLEKHKRFVTAVTVALSIASGVYYAVLPDRYSADAQVLIEKIDKTTDKIDQHQELVLPSMTAERDYILTQAMIMTSNKILGRALEGSGLAGQIDLRSARDAGAEHHLFRSKASGSSLPLYSAAALNTKDSRLILLKIKGPDPEMCQRLANAVADAYVDENARENLFISQRVYSWLMDREGPDGEMKDVEGKEAMIASLDRIVNDPEIQRWEVQKAQIIAELRESSKKYLPRHPLIQRIAGSLEDVNRKIAERRDLLTTNLKDTLGGASRISNVRILDRAVLPDHPDAPDRFAGWLLGTLLGFLGASFFLMGRESLNRTIRTEKDMPREFKVPCLGAVPGAKGLKRAFERSSASTFLHALREDLELRDAVVSIRTHILFSMPFEKSRKIMFAGATPDKEESAVPILTALSMASMGREIVLVDADMRNPGIHAHLGLEKGKGLADYLAGDAVLDEVVRTVPGSTLKVIAGGQPNLNSSALLASPRFDELVAKLVSKFDRVFVNVPPILYVPDAMIVAKNVSCVVLVCSSGVTKKESVLSAIDKFITMDRPLMGYVINRVLRDKELKGQSEKDYKNYKSNYLKIQPHPSIASAVPAAVPAVADSVQRKIN